MSNKPDAGRAKPDRQRPLHCQAPVLTSPATHSPGEIHARSRPKPRRGVAAPAPPLLSRPTPPQLSPAARSGQPSSELPAPLHTTRLSSPRAHLRMHESLAANGDRAVPGPAAPPVAERLRRPLQLPLAAASARGLCSRPGSDALPTPTLGNQEAWTTQSPRVIWRRPGRPVRSPHRAAASSAAVPLLRPGRPGPISESKGREGRRAGVVGDGRRAPLQAALLSLYMYEAAQGAGAGPAAVPHIQRRPSRWGYKKGPGQGSRRQREVAGRARAHRRPSRRASRAPRAPSAQHHAGRRPPAGARRHAQRAGASWAQQPGGTAGGQHHAGRAPAPARPSHNITPAPAGGPGAGRCARRQVDASEAGQGTPAQRRHASGSERRQLQRHAHIAAAQRTAARRPASPSWGQPIPAAAAQLLPIAAADQAVRFSSCYRPAGRRVVSQAEHSHPVRTPERGSAVGVATGLARYSTRIPIGCESSRHPVRPE